MVPLKDLLKTTGYAHGANTPIGIYEKFGYPIYIDDEAKEQGDIFVSSGQIGRSVKVNATEIARLTKAKFVDIKKNNHLLALYSNLNSFRKSCIY